MTVARNRVVSMRYIMKDGGGAILENTMNSAPVSYLHGGIGIQAALQAPLEGMKAGDMATVYLDAATGLTSTDFSFDIIIDEVRAAQEEELLLGYPVQLAVQPCQPGCDCYTGK